MIRMKNRPCAEQAQSVEALPAMSVLHAQEGGTSVSYEQMLAGAAGTEMASASGEFQGTPDKIEEVQTVDQMVYNSWKGMLARNIGRSVIVSFLVGTQSTVVAAGTLQEVGNDYITLFHPGRQAYLTADLYSIRFVEFPQGRESLPLN